MECDKCGGAINGLINFTGSSPCTCKEMSKETKEFIEEQQALKNAGFASMAIPTSDPLFDGRRLLDGNRSMGWECPVCGAGLSPDVWKCSCKDTFTHSSGERE